MGGLVRRTRQGQEAFSSNVHVKKWSKNGPRATEPFGGLPAYKRRRGARRTFVKKKRLIRWFSSSIYPIMAVYPEYMVAPIRQDLVEAGFEQLMSPQEVDAALDPTEGTVLVAVNSVCGCAAGKARPALKLALASAEKKPTKLVTVFAGMETDAVAKMREHMLPYPPSSPCIGLFKDGELVHMIERYHIEGSDMMRIVNNLQGAFEEYC
jgi:putative YphP/YqiW family bacilliredoxin